MKPQKRMLRLACMAVLTVILLQAGAAVGQPQSKIPIVLAPGMTASVNWSCFLFESGCDLPGNWGWMPTAQGYYQSLIDRFAAAGYTQENGYLTVFFYDWRRPLSENADKLKSRIAQIKVETGTSQVDLVGHSMGGLVSRAYVQSSSYADDVAHLITLGSPHYGAARTYPYWEGAYLYQAGMSERIALSVLLAYYMIQTYNPFPVFVLREKVPSGANLLPTIDYLFDENNSDQVIPESSLVHRNTFLQSLNSNLDTLFARADVTTIAGNGVETPARLYVHDRDWIQWPNWDDGEPNWDRQTEFELPQGDGTVLQSSAILPAPAHTYSFSNVDHGALPGDEQVIQIIFTRLGINLPTLRLSQPYTTEPAVIVLLLSGGVEAVITDPLGRTLDKFGSTIPGGEYSNHPSDPFKLLIVSDPAEGKFIINIQATSSGDYEVGLLDTFNGLELITDVLSLWDKPHSYIDQGLNTTFELTYAQSNPTATALIASMPIIETPVTFNNLIVNGRAIPEQWIAIKDSTTNEVLGGGLSTADGHFSALIYPWKSLTLGQRIYAEVNALAGVSVPVTGIPLYLPLVRH